MYHEQNANLFWILLILLSIQTCAIPLILICIAINA
jgi:hypothetical protein